MKRKSKKNILWAIGREIVIIGICAIIAQGIVIMSYDEKGESVIGDGEIVFLFIMGLQYAITWIAEGMYLLSGKRLNCSLRF